MQEECLSFVEERIISGNNSSIAEVLRSARAEYNIPMRTLKRWYKHFCEFGEYPFETKRREKAIRRQMRKYKVTNIVTSDIISSVKHIVDEHPEFYLDEIQTSLCVNSHVYLSLTTVHRILKEKLGYSLQVCHAAARQRDEFQREQYKAALEGLVSHPNQLVFVDETHKDQQASRRRKAWGARNSGGVSLRRWFVTKNKVYDDCIN